MNPQTEFIPGLTSSVTFWATLWQKQFEQNLKFWAALTQTLPHPTAKELAAEAAAEKPKRRSRARAKPAAA